MKNLALCLLMICFSLNIQAQSPAGTWVVTVPCDCPDQDEMTWKWTVKTDRTYEVDLNVDGTVEMTGRYWVDGNKITVQNDGGCTEKGTYEFTVEGDHLRVNALDDSCEGRNLPKKMTFTKD